MKKLMFLAVFLILAIGGVLLSYQNLKSDELQRELDIKIQGLNFITDLED